MPGIFLILTLCCCSRPTGETIALSDLPPVIVGAESDSIIEIKNWLAIGPFEFNPLLTDPKKTFFRKDLKRYGITEGSVNEEAIKKLQKKGIDVFLIDSPSPQIKLFEYVFEKLKKKSNFYLVSRIHSEKARNVTLIIDGSYSYAVWLNGDKLIEVKGKYNTNKAGDRFVNVSLKEGENTLFVKINRGSNVRSWDLICAVAPRGEAERIFRVNYSGDFVVNPIITGSLEVYAGPYMNGKVEIMDGANQMIACGSFDGQNTNDQPFILSSLQKLEEGFYKAILTIGGEKLEETIYKGDYRKFVNNAEASVAEISSDSPYSGDLTAAVQRVAFLNDKPGDPDSSNETRFLNRNRVFWGYALYRMLHKNALTQLMTYTDENNNLGVFIFHTGSKQRQNIPLVIIVPSALQGNSMIEDWYTSNLDQIETDNALAGQYGFDVAWIYAEGKNYSANKTEKEITAVINRLQSEYAIAGQKIFIMGDCEGGRRALVQLAATPNRYAACVVSSPITLSGGIDGVPVDLLSQMGDIPILITHGTDDNVSPIENSRRFYAEAQKLNMPVKYAEIQGSHVCISKDSHRFVFEFFSRIESGQK
ncbi:MAG: hypothetical protein FWF53_05740 [Candidatus Azobacteroides sp.]|nr:hypothetical protein [Candidatus Azobacteroides sp.]